jgi:selenocysteine lyase/cysteine desulfurase
VREAIERIAPSSTKIPDWRWIGILGATNNCEQNVRVWAGKYLQAKPGQIALTGSTTEGLTMIYGSVQVRADQEILTTEHEHYSTRNILDFRSRT